MLFHYVIRGLWIRKWATLRTGIALGVVCAACILTLAVVRGLSKTLQTAGDDRNVLILPEGASNQGSGALSKQMLNELQVLPGIASVDGNPLVSIEHMRYVTYRSRSGNQREDSL